MSPNISVSLSCEVLSSEEFRFVCLGFISCVDVFTGELDGAWLSRRSTWGPVHFERHFSLGDTQLGVTWSRGL